MDVDRGAHQSDHLAQGGRVLPARHGGLRWQVAPGVGQAPAGELQARVSAQAIEVVGVLVVAGDGQHAGTQDVGQRVPHPCRVTRVRDPGCQPPCQVQPPLGRREQQDATIGREAAAVESGDKLLAPDGWQRKRQGRIIVQGGCSGL